VELILGANYSIVEAGLPGEFGVVLGPYAFCAFAFELTNDRSPVCLAHLADASFVETPRWGVSVPLKKTAERQGETAERQGDRRKGDGPAGRLYEGVEGC